MNVFAQMGVFTNSRVHELHEFPSSFNYSETHAQVLISLSVSFRFYQ